MDKAATMLGCVVLFLLLMKVQESEAGECCRAYTDGLGRYHSQKWCPLFCCGYGHSMMGLTCCMNPENRAHPESRDDWCASWFTATHNIWAPIIIAIVVLAIIIASCICCVRCCCIF